MNTLKGICHGCGKWSGALKLKHELDFPPTVYCPDCIINYRRPSRAQTKTTCKTCLKEITPRELIITTGADHHIHIRCILQDKPTDWVCPKCGKQLWFKWTKWKRILSCSSCDFILDRVPRDGKQIKVFDLNAEWTQKETDDFIKRLSGK